MSLAEYLSTAFLMSETRLRKRHNMSRMKEKLVIAGSFCFVGFLLIFMLYSSKEQTPVAQPLRADRLVLEQARQMEDLALSTTEEADLQDSTGHTDSNLSSSTEPFTRSPSEVANLTQIQSTEAGIIRDVESTTTGEQMETMSGDGSKTNEAINSTTALNLEGLNSTEVQQLQKPSDASSEPSSSTLETRFPVQSELSVQENVNDAWNISRTEGIQEKQHIDELKSGDLTTETPFSSTENTEKSDRTSTSAKPESENQETKKIKKSDIPEAEEEEDE